MMKPLRRIVLLLLLFAALTLSCQLLTGGSEPAADPLAESAEAPGDLAGASEDVPASDQVTAEPTAETSVPEPTAIPTATMPPTDEESIAESGTDEASEDTPTATEGAAASAAGAGDEELGQVLGDFEFSAIADTLDFDSYRFDLTMDFEGTNAQGEAISQHIGGATAYVAEPYAMSMEWNIEGVDETAEFDRIVMAQIADTIYMVVPELGCVTSSSAGTDLFDDNPFAGLLDPGQLVGDLEGVERSGEDVVNDVPVVIYSFKQRFPEDEDLDWSEGQIYVAKDGQYIVRMAIDGEGAMNLSDDPTSETGVFHFEFDLYDINQPFEVSIPVDCEDVGADGVDVPLLEDAYEVNSFAGVVSYQSNTSFEDAMAFYETVLAAEGWMEDEEESLVMEGTALLTYHKEGESLNLTIGEEDESDAIYVLIIKE